MGQVEMSLTWEEGSWEVKGDLEKLIYKPRVTEDYSHTDSSPKSPEKETWSAGLLALKL